MKIQSIAVAFVLAALGCGPASARADDAALRQELQETYNTITNAIKNKERGVAIKYVEPNYAERDVFGKKSTLKEVQERLEKNLAMTESIQKFAIDVQQVVSNDKLAVALVKRRVIATIKDPKDKPHKFTADSMGLDVWKKTDDGWKLRFSDGLSMSQTLDGKPMKVPTRRAAHAAAGGATPAGALAFRQFYYTPYNYGWSGYGNSYGYGYGYGGIGAPGARYAAGTAVAASNVTYAVNAQNAGTQRANYQAQRQYEKAVKAQKQQQAKLKELQKTMQQYLALQQGQLQGGQGGQTPTPQNPGSLRR
jgi:hypothetical protein